MIDKKYKVVIDARGSQDGFKEHSHRGIGRHVFALAPRLPALLPDAQIYWLLDSRFAHRKLETPPGVIEIFSATNRLYEKLPELFRNQLAVKSVLKTIRPQVTLFFREDDALIFWPGSAVFIHDMIAYIFPELYRTYSSLKSKMRAHYIKQTARNAELIFTVSENSKSDIMNCWNLPGDKICVVYAAIDHETFFRRSEAEILSARQRYSLPENYLLYVGGIDPRKNIPNMLRAFKILADEFEGLSLIFAGRLKDQVGYIELERLIEELNLGRKMIMPGFIPDNDLSAVYSGARALIFPSLCEGFGLPAIEALACGIPVVAAKASAIPEIAGDLAIYCDVRDSSALAVAIRQVLIGNVDCARFQTEGPTRARLFNWEYVANRVAAGIRIQLEATKI